MISTKDSTELVDCIISTLQSSSTDRENILLELIGFEFIDILPDIINHRQDIIESWELEKIGKAAAMKAEDASPGQKIKVRSTSTLNEIRQGEKLAKKKGIVLSAFSTQMHMTDQLSALSLDADASNCGSAAEVNYPGVFKASTTSSVSSYINKLAIPVGTIRDDTLIYEEFDLPYTAHGKNPKIGLIKTKLISDLDDISRKAFPSYKSLNKMQSAVYQVAHRTNENLLVCAPTGAGKTDVAMLTVLRCILDNIRDGTIRKDRFKIVYVAPMKALAAEVTEKFGCRLKPLGLTVKEYTGDMQLTRSEVQACQMIVTTPEKWDVITRKSQGDIDLVDLVQLLIIDEVHLLQDDRGPVLETIVARTLRSVELNQKPVRIIGLSATLPNYIDVASFLRVNLHVGMFYFDESFRPVPLSQTLIGIKGHSESQQRERLSKVCFDRTVEFLREGHQVMIFVHSRNETVATAKLLISMAREEGLSSLFLPSDTEEMEYKKASADLFKNSRNRELQDLFRSGLAMHHAGILRSDRTMVEQLFGSGHIRVLVCTATLAWGVNLPAHAVIIKGTQLWDSQKGGHVRLGVLDVLQIFGRAGRPQYETFGEAVLLTKQADLYHYLQALLTQTPIESRFSSGSHLTDMLNAEITLGTVGSIDEAIRWLGYTYLRIRMLRNPTGYGMTIKDMQKDPNLDEQLRRLVTASVLTLRAAAMISYDPDSGKVSARDIGRIASYFYLGHETVELFGRLMNSLSVTEESVLTMIAQSAEFNQLKVRQEELEELDCIEDTSAHLLIKGIDKTTSAGKAALLIQAWISRHPLDSFSLNSDLNYIGQNAGRILRAAWEMAKSQGWARAARACLSLALAFERQTWMTAHPLCQVLLSSRSKKKPNMPIEVLNALQSSNLKHSEILKLSIVQLKTKLGMKNSSSTSQKSFELINNAAAILPIVSLTRSSCYPISSSGFEVSLEIAVSFVWDEFYHPSLELFHVWLESVDGEHLLSKENVAEVVIRRDVMSKKISFFIQSLPKRMFVRILSDKWMLPEALFEINVKNIKTPEKFVSKPTEAHHIDEASQNHLQILGVHTESLNPIMKHMIQYVDEGGLFCAPSKSDLDLFLKLIVMKHVQRKMIILSHHSEHQVFELRNIGLSMDHVKVLAPKSHDLKCDILVLRDLDIFNFNYEMVLASIPNGCKVFVLSGPIGNIQDFAKLLNVENVVSYGPESRPTPLQAQIQVFHDRYHTSRLASMNRPIYQVALNYHKVLIWCPSKKQVTLTAQALISLTSNDDAPSRFVNCEYLPELEGSRAFKNALAFGVGIYHSGSQNSSQLAELFENSKIRVLIASLESVFDLEGMTADLVVVKGTDILQGSEFVEAPSWLIRRALTGFSKAYTGRPPLVILMTRDNQRSFYRQSICDSPLIESTLSSFDNLSDFLQNRAALTVSDAIQDLKLRTVLPSRICQSPNYYGCSGDGEVEVDEFLWKLAKQVVDFSPKVPGKICTKAASLLKLDKSALLDCQTVLRIVSMAISAEITRRQELEILPFHFKHNPIELEGFCKSNTSLKTAFSWLYGTKNFQKIIENFEDETTLYLVSLLSILVGGSSSLPTKIKRTELKVLTLECLGIMIDQLSVDWISKTAESILRLLVSVHLATLPDALPVNNSILSWKMGGDKIWYEVPKVFVSRAKKSMDTSQKIVEGGWLLLESDDVLLLSPKYLKPCEKIHVPSSHKAALFTEAGIFQRS